MATDLGKVKRWKVTYSYGDDISSVWVYAKDENSAIEEVKGEYWDAEEIINVQEI